MTPIVVFGGSGFVGRNLINDLTSKVERLVSISKTGSIVEGSTESYGIDRLHYVPDLPKDTIVVNVAAHRYDAKRFDRAQSEILLANASLVQRVYEFCLERGITEVRAASSVAVYPAGQGPPRRLRAGRPQSPCRTRTRPSTAGRSAGGELIARLYADKYGISTLSFRISNVYGPLDSTDPSNAHVLPAFVMRALRPGPTFEIKGDPNFERDFIFVSDVCEILEASFAQRGRTDALNLCTGQTTSLRELASTILTLTGESRAIVTSAATVAGVKARRSPNRRLRDLFGKTTFVSLEDGLARTLDWYRDALAV